MKNNKFQTLGLTLTCLLKVNSRKDMSFKFRRDIAQFKLQL